MKPNYETIYLVPTDYVGGQLTYSWCDCPAPGEGMDPEDAIKYVRADLVPASNEVLARRIVELTNERDAALAQLVEVQDNRTGKAPCERFCEALATKIMFDNLQEDNRRLRAKLEQLDTLVVLSRRCLWSAFIWNDHNFESLAKICRQTAVELGIRDIEDANQFIQQFSKPAGTWLKDSNTHCNAKGE